MEELMLVENPMYWNPPKRRSKVRKNAVRTVTKEWFKGVRPMDVGAATGGLAMSTMLPGMLVSDSTTQTNKIIKLVVSAACAAASGFIFQNIDSRAGQMAVAGGLAGTMVQAIGMFTDFQIGQPGSVRRSLPVGRRAIGESRFVVPTYPHEEGVQVSVT